LPSPVAGFRLHLGFSSGNYVTVLDVLMPTLDENGEFEVSLPVADAAVLYVAMTAYDFANLESDFSNEQVRSPVTNAPPESRIDSPTGPLTITEGDSVVFTGSGTDPDGDLPLTYSWDFGDPTLAPSSAKDPGSVVFSQVGTFGVSFTVTDSKGLADPTPATVTIVVDPPSDPNSSFVPASGTVDVAWVATGFDAPVYLTSPSGDPRLFVLEAGGRILIVENGSVLAAPYLDLSSDVSHAPDGGLLGLAFDPDYDQNGFFYVHRTAFSGDSVLSRFSVSSDPDVADASSEEVLLQLPQPFAGQNGGAIAFGPDDGFLYVGLGDGGSTGDPGNRAQDGDSLLGKLLRLDVGVPPAPDSIPNGTYAIPADNPFVGDPGVRDEIWALGLRNPYRFSFDRELWDLWLADEGQDAREEVNFEPWGAAGGNNYGWDVMEGAICNDDDPAPAPSCGDISLVQPLHDYSHTNGNCAITGGYVYRGVTQDMVGQYFFADFCSGGVWSLDALTGEGTNWTQALGEAAGKPDQLVSFGEGGNGDLYVLHIAGDIYRIGSTDPVCDEGTDSDCDGIPDDGAPGDVPCATGQFEGCDDNCPFASNPGQEDTAGIGSGSAPDGIGDECQCGDVSGDGVVSSADSVIILRSQLVPPTAVMSRPDLCDVGGSVGCAGADSVIVLRAQLVPPTATIQQVCAPANPPL
jgi:glucose/arabinose dehydrogenase